MGDSRKDFVLTTTANFFGIAPNDGEITKNQNAPAINTFLDDGSASVLAARSEGKTVAFSNKVSTYFHVEFLNGS